MAETAALQTPGAPAGRRGTPLPTSPLKGGGVNATAIARSPKIPNAIALGIWVFGVGMLVQNWRRAKAGKNRHTESMTALSELIRRTSPPQPSPAE